MRERYGEIKGEDIKNCMQNIIIYYLCVSAVEPSQQSTYLVRICELLFLYFSRVVGVVYRRKIASFVSRGYINK